MSQNRAINSPWMYAFGMLAMMIPSHAFSTFYVFYYSDELNLGLGLLTLGRLIYLIWDAVNQPLAGYLSDRTNTKYGRRKPWINISIPLFMLSFIMVFSPPGGMSEFGLFTWFLITLLIFEAVATILWVNYGALFPELFRGGEQRVKASSIQQAYQIIAILIVSVAAPIIIDALGYGKMSIILALLFVLFMFICMRFTKEDENARSAPQMKLKEAFSSTLTNKPFWIFNLSNSFAQTVNGLLSATIPFYAKYVLKIPVEQVTILLASIFVSVIPLVGVWYYLIRKMEPVKAWRLSLFAYALSVIPLWFGSSLVGGIIAGIIVGFGLAGFFVTPALVNSVIIDRDFAATGRRREGVYTAVAGFINRSSGLISALAFLIVGVIFGYENGDNPGNDPETTFRVLISLIPFILLTISIILSYFVKLKGEGNKGYDN
ncbi:MFS transporter [Paenibacillus sp. GSMTC-2017]|uniref:MFS transporter n=1 Tax=Paenibacillus sp. GSMTC-2017 TaxID=2794350 RepID=UPI0018D7D5D6|nr:MFS transporter [Paenibacillus sp. GSMTC-2017]MBH5318882.1 MFS transporter [Paenibacillus sp. GSMTC-2017]